MDWLPPRRYADEMEAETARLAAATAQMPIDRKIDTCPEWTVRDLVTHVGTGHRLAAGVIEERRAGPGGYRLIDAPDDRGEWPAWLAEGARRLNAAVDRIGFDSPVWTTQPKYRKAGFWQRRMLHDLIVHRFDADPGGDLAPDLAADGIEDVLLAFERFGRPKFTGEGETLRFTATDVGQSWAVALTPDGIARVDADRPASVTVTATVRDLLLSLNRRREPATVEGDRALWERWREDARF